MGRTSVGTEYSNGFNNFSVMFVLHQQDHDLNMFLERPKNSIQSLGQKASSDHPQNDLF